MQQLPLIHHSTAIFALAFSRDGRLLAVGGASNSVAVTVWDFQLGALFATLSGHTGQVHSVSISSDSRYLAAVNVYGGLSIWDISTGLLIDQKPNSSTRRDRKVYFLDSTYKSDIPDPIVTSMSLSRSGPNRDIAPNGLFVVVSYGWTIRVQRYRTTRIVATLDISSLKKDFLTAPPRYISWSPDSAAIALYGDGWCGVWKYQEHITTLHPAPLTDFVHAIAIPPTHSMVVCATGTQSLEFVALPTAHPGSPSPAPTSWQLYLSQLSSPGANIEKPPQTNWEWNITSGGYDGVSLQALDLIWYRHEHNTLAGGSALVQSMNDFLANGPLLPIPDDILAQVAVTVLNLP